TAVNRYLELPYHVTLVHVRDNDGNSGWVASAEELPGCLAQGATPDEAVENLRDAMAGWIEVGIEQGQEIPAPRSEQADAFSGRFLVRLPRSLHAELNRAARHEG